MGKRLIVLNDFKNTGVVFGNFQIEYQPFTDCL
jgi:hypothetical protein